MIRSLLNRVGSFLIFSILFIAIISFLALTIVNYKIDYKLDNHIEYVVFGHSHSESSVNDSIIPNFKNLSSSAESYFYTYLKVKKILSNNSQIHTIFIEFTNNNVDNKMDEWTCGEEYLMARSPVYFPMMSKLDCNYIYSNNSNDFWSALSKSVRYNIIKIIRSNYQLSKEFGGYKPLYDNKIGLGDHHQEKINYKELSSDNILYLKRIIKFCKFNNIKIYLFRSPQHQSYNFLNNEELFQKIKNQEFSSVDFLDFNLFPLKDKDFSDYAHLNSRGATKFSSFFNSLIKEGLLQRKNRQAYIDQMMRIFKKDSIKNDELGT